MVRAGNFTVRSLWAYALALPLALVGCHRSEAAPSVAAPVPSPVVIDDAFREMPLGRRLELAYDPTGALSAEDVLAGKLPFAPSTKEVPSFGYRRGAEWARVTLDDRRGAGREALRFVFDYGQVDRLEVYDVVGGEVVRRRVAGDQVPTRDWDADVSRAPAFPVGPGPVTLLVRNVGEHAHQFPVWLRARDRHEEARRGDVLAQALFFGALLAMVAYNALLAAVTRSRTYMHYVGYLVSYVGLALAQNGLLVHAQPAHTPIVNFAVPWSIAAIGFFSMRFARLLLALPSGGRWARALETLSVALPCLVAVACTVSYPVAIRVALALTVPWSVLLIGSGVSAARRGSRVARTFLVAWAAFIVGSVVNALRVAGALPTNPLTANLHQIGSALEFLLLSLALASRIKELQAEATANARLAADNALAAEKATALALAEQRRANDEQARANDELQRMDKLKDAFLANTSHELRTPLNGILGLVETTLGGAVGAVPSPVKRNLELVRASGRRLATLVNDILDFSRLRERTVALREAPVALHAVVELTLQTLAPLATDKRLRLVNEVPEGIGARADEDRLQQILTNLVGNAIKFTHEGGVTVRAAERDGRVTVSVQDTGIGIPKESQARIFESFEQADGSTARAYGGTGLGLAVTKQLVELHGGRVELASEPGEGSTFTFDLAAAEVPEEVVQSARGALASAPSMMRMGVSGEQGPASTTPQDLRVLVVDDEPINREVLAQHLMSKGFAVLHAQDGAQAIELIASARPDVVLLDVMMPKKTGYDVLEAVRPQREAVELPVLLLTAKAQESDLRHGFALGASDYLLKPVSFVELDARLAHHTRLLRSARALAVRTTELEHTQEALRAAMNNLRVTEIAPGVQWLQVPEAGLYVLCGCPAEVVKHMMRRGFVVPERRGGAPCETGPNAILLSEALFQNGSLANATEFPVLQMLYRQGMLLPGHPNNTGAKPLIVGVEDQVRAQIAYIHRGNYGLLSHEELVAAGAAPEEADRMMRVKRRFAFGKIRPAEEILAPVVVAGAAPVEVKGGVTVSRVAFNVFRFAFRGESVDVDLNLPKGAVYESPYGLDHHRSPRETFAVLHTGEGDGWDTKRPSMSSALLVNGRVYLVDAPPNVADTLLRVGVDVSEVAGVFHTHGHDDHFLGLFTLAQADHRIAYYATPTVRAAVQKKFAALLGGDEGAFERFFEPRDLVQDAWNACDGVEVLPAYAPHPVENAVYTFRARGEDGVTKTYAHWADLTPFPLLDAMAGDGPDQVPASFVEGIKQALLAPADLKKLDVGGGMIHGRAEDFRSDGSARLALAHIARELTDDEKSIGAAARFGSTDVLIPASKSWVREGAAATLRALFPLFPGDALEELAASPIVEVNAGTNVLKDGDALESLDLLVTGGMEHLVPSEGLRFDLAVGTLLGLDAFVEGAAARGTWRATSHVRLLRMPAARVRALLEAHDTNGAFADDLRGALALRRSWLTRDRLGLLALLRIVRASRPVSLSAGEAWEERRDGELLHVHAGTLAGPRGESATSDDWLGSLPFGDRGPARRWVAQGAVQGVAIARDAVLGVPVLTMRLLERGAREALFMGPAA